jgi:predicted MFS family arabinose efflux permease
MLACGTAIFKPGIQGLIASQITAETGSFAWSIFYQVVNIGGFLGPYLAGVMRLLAWRYVFFACAAIASLNLVWLLFIKEPERERRSADLRELGMVAVRGIGGIMEPRLFAFLAIFSGFWAMFYQLYDLLPNFIDDWVDSSAIYQGLVVPLFAFFGSTPPEAWGGNVSQEHMININSLMIMTTVSAIGYFAGRFRSMTNMTVGIVISAAGILMLNTNQGTGILLAIVVFSIGEMLASPTKMRYVADLATPDKKALYLGYVNATVGIGWTIGSWIAGPMYEQTGDKVALARRYLEETVGLDAATVKALPKSEVITRLGTELGKSSDQVRDLLWSVSAPSTVWFTFAQIGLTSMVGMIIFDQITRRKLAQEEPVLIGMVALISTLCYGPFYGAMFAGLMIVRMVAEKALRVSGSEDAWQPGAIAMGLAIGGGIVWKVVT